MDSADNSSSSSSNLSLNLEYPIFKLKFPCDGVPWERKKKQKAPEEVKAEDVWSIASHDIPWLSHNRQFCKIAFDEKLIVCKTLDKMVGEAVVNVYITQEYDLLLHCDWKLFDTESFLESFEVPDNISFTSLMRRNLTTLEEKYCEIDHKNNRENHIYICEKLDSYHVSRTMEEMTQIMLEENFEYCFDKLKDILTQGSLILLLRQMTVLNIQKVDPLSVLMSDGKLYDITFQLAGDFHCVLFDDKFEILVKRIVADITDPKSGLLREKLTTFMSENGRIVYQEWKSKRVVLRFDPRKDITSDYCSRQPVVKLTSRLPLEKVWRQDIQLNSMFTQQNRAFQREYETFYERHPQLRCTLRDYLKDILMVKPKCPLTYTIQYFNEFLF